MRGETASMKNTSGRLVNRYRKAGGNKLDIIILPNIRTQSLYILTPGTAPEMLGQRNSLLIL